MAREKIKKVNEIAKISEDLKKKGKKVVTTNGVFDIIHIGHVRYLKEARELGDILIICVNSDSSVKKIKGSERPINDEKSRVEVISFLECVDYVTIFDETDPTRILSDIKPDIHVKGGDYKIEDIIERETVEKQGGKVILIPMVDGFSTTKIVGKIEENKK